LALLRIADLDKVTVSIKTTNQNRFYQSFFVLAGTTSINQPKANDAYPHCRVNVAAGA
jgi:hypothetical protein